MGFAGRTKARVNGSSSRDSVFAEKLFAVFDEADQHDHRRPDHPQEEHRFKHADKAYSFITDLFPVNPATNAAWTLADINALLAGYSLAS